MITDHGTVMTLGHRSLHQNGGEDEIATATATANAIPKAGSAGLLALAWLSNVVPLSALRSALAGTFAFDVTGMTSAMSGTARYQRFETTIILTFPTVSGTSSATSFRLTGIPASLAPNQDLALGVLGNNSAAFVPATALLSTGGSAVLFYNLAVASAVSWGISGAKTIYGWTLVWT